MTPTPTVGRRALAEFLGTAFLLTAIVGSGIAAQRLSPNDAGLELLENAAATAAALAAIILAVGPVSGAHLNPAVTLAAVWFRAMTLFECFVYWTAQIGGAVVGTAAANLMFALPVVTLSQKARWGSGLWFGEVIATFGLILIVFGASRSEHKGHAAYAVGLYIAGAYWFTSSTSFANPAVSIARTLSDTFAGIAPSSVPPFILAELAGALLGILSVRLLYPGSPARHDESQVALQLVPADDRTTAT